MTNLTQNAKTSVGVSVVTGILAQSMNKIALINPEALLSFEIKDAIFITGTAFIASTVAGVLNATNTLGQFLIKDLSAPESIAMSNLSFAKITDVDPESPLVFTQAYSTTFREKVITFAVGFDKYKQTKVIVESGSVNPVTKEYHFIDWKQFTVKSANPDTIALEIFQRAELLTRPEGVATVGKSTGKKSTVNSAHRASAVRSIRSTWGAVPTAPLATTIAPEIAQAPVAKPVAPEVETPNEELSEEEQLALLEAEYADEASAAIDEDGYDEDPIDQE